MNELMKLPTPGNSGECSHSQHAEMSFFFFNYYFLIDGVFLLLTLQEGPVIPDANMLNLCFPGI